jgi:hypothetical protein
VLRSALAPAWLQALDGAAVGRLEDTRQAKRLIADDGAELLSAHLACFAFARPDAGAALLHAARARAAGIGLPALFVCVAPTDAPALTAALALPGVVVAPATVYGVGLDAGPDWNFNTSEI